MVIPGQLVALVAPRQCEALHTMSSEKWMPRLAIPKGGLNLQMPKQRTEASQGDEHAVHPLPMKKQRPKLKSENDAGVAVVQQLR